VAPAIVCASIAVLDMLTDSTDLRDTLEKNTLFFRDELTKNGFDIKKGEHPIVPIMLYDAKLAQNIASDMLEKGIYVIGFSFPVVPKNEARIRVQISAAHTNDHLKKAISSFVEIGKKHGVIN
jgi:glycine C-acetyltransferase